MAGNPYYPTDRQASLFTGTGSVAFHGGNTTFIEGDYIQNFVTRAPDTRRPTDWEEHTRIREGRADGTCVWILDTPEVKTWLENPTARLLWLRGGAETGKTVIVSTIVDFLQQRIDTGIQAILLFVYMDEDVVDESRPRRAAWSFSALLHRLLAQINFGSHTLFTEDQWKSVRAERNFERLLAMLYEGFRGYGEPIYIVLDGVENFSKSDGDLEQLLDRLVARMPSNVKLLIASRRTPGFASVLSQFQAKFRDIEPPAQDIEIYLRKRIRVEMRKYAKWEDEICGRIMEILAGRSSYALALHLFQPLCKSRSPGKLEENLERLPGNLEAYCAGILYSIDQQDEEDALLARKILSWVAAGRLTLEELQYALAIKKGRTKLRDHFDDDAEAYFVEICKGLIKITPNSDFDEGMEDEDEDEDMEQNQAGLMVSLTYHDPRKTHKIEDFLKDSLGNTNVFMARAFIELLLHDSRFTVTGLRQRNSNLSDALSELIDEEPFLTYIRDAWDYRTEPDEALIVDELCNYFIDDDRAGFLLVLKEESLPNPPVHASLGFHAAARSRLFLTFFKLLRNGAKWYPDPSLLEFFEMEGRTLVHLAAEYGSMEDFEAAFRLEGVESLERRNDNGRTVFSIAAGTGGFDIVAALIPMGVVDINSRDRDNRTPLSWAVDLREDDLDETHWEQIKTISLLVQQPAIEVNAQDADGRTALSYAAALDCDERTQRRVISALLGHRGIDVNLPDGKGRIAADYASEGGRPGIVAMLQRPDQPRVSTWLSQSG